MGGYLPLPSILPKVSVQCFFLLKPVTVKNDPSFPLNIMFITVFSLNYTLKCLQLERPVSVAKIKQNEFILLRSHFTSFIVHKIISSPKKTNSFNG